MARRIVDTYDINNNNCALQQNVSDTDEDTCRSRRNCFFCDWGLRSRCVRSVTVWPLLTACFMSSRLDNALCTPPPKKKKKNKQKNN